MTYTLLKTQWMFCAKFESEVCVSFYNVCQLYSCVPEEESYVKPFYLPKYNVSHQRTAKYGD